MSGIVLASLGSSRPTVDSLLSGYTTLYNKNKIFEYMDDAGNFQSFPAQGNDFEYLDTISGVAASEIDVDGYFVHTNHDMYMIKLNMTNVSNSFGFRIGAGGGSFDSGAGNYKWCSDTLSDAGTLSPGGNTGASSWSFSLGSSILFERATLFVFGMNGTGTPAIQFNSTYDFTGAPRRFKATGIFVGSSSGFDSFRIFASGGGSPTIDASMDIFGLRKP